MKAAYQLSRREVFTQRFWLDWNVFLSAIPAVLLEIKARKYSTCFNWSAVQLIFALIFFRLELNFCWRIKKDKPIIEFA